MNFGETLLSSKPISSVRPELLEMLGKQAAKMFLDQRVPLNQAIVSLAGGHSNLESEHLRRIVEFANNEVFLHLHANSDDKVVDFEIADPGVVLRDLRDGGSPAQDGKTLSSQNKDYLTPPQPAPMEKQQEFGDVDSALRSLFLQNHHNGTAGQGEQMPKVASVHTDHSRHANPLEDVYDLYIRQEATRAHLAEAYETLHGLVKQAQEELYQSVKKEVLDPDGAGLGGAISVIERLSSSPETAEAVIKPIAQRLVTDRVAPPKQLEESLHKTAGRFINPSHPLVVSYTGLVKAAQDKLQVEEALKQTCATIDQLEAAMRSAR